MEKRIAHFGYSSNYGGVEAYIRNLNNFISMPIDLIVTFDGPIPFEKEFTQKGGRIFRITSRKKNYIRHYMDLCRVLSKKNNIAALHVHLNSCSSIAPLKAARLMGVHCIAHSHTSKPWGGRISSILHRINQKLLRFVSDYRFACSDDAGKYMFPGLDFQVAKNGIDTDKFAFAPEKRDKIRQEFHIENKYVIGHAGLFSEIKNQSFLVDVLHDYVKIKPNAVLMLVGDGSNMANVQSKVSSLGLDDSVVFTNKRTDMPDLFCGMDVFTLPSLFEGMPLTVVEALANGLHVVVSDRIPKEVVLSDAVHMLQLEKGLWVQQLDALSKAPSRYDSREKLVRAGYDIKASAGIMEDFYREIVHG